MLDLSELGFEHKVCEAEIWGSVVRVIVSEAMDKSKDANDQECCHYGEHYR